MISAAQYTDLTGAEAPPDFEHKRDLVVTTLELALGRWFASAERVEVCDVFADGIVYPMATPITEFDGQFTDRWIYLAWPIRDHSTVVTYTGGWQAYEAEADGLPVGLASAIAWGVHTLSNPSSTGLPSGVQSMSIAGEYSISREVGSRWGADGEPLPTWAQSISHLGGRCAQLAAPYRRLA
jgi:hypothetical protein